MTLTESYETLTLIGNKLVRLKVGMEDYKMQGHSEDPCLMLYPML